MDSNIIIIICIAIFIIAVGAVFGIKVYQNYKKNGEKFNLKDFIDKYGNQIIEILKDVVKILKTSETKFSTKEEYEKEIIKITISEITQNYKDIGIDADIMSIISPETLSNIIYDILHGNAIDIFSVLDASDINENRELFDKEVVATIAGSE